MLRYEISRRQLGEKIARGEFNGLPVDIGHASEYGAVVGTITDAAQAKTNGSVFVRLTVKPGSLESDYAITMMRNGQMRGLSLEHDSSTDDRKLLGVGVTPKPRRPNTFLLPEGTEPTSSATTTTRNGHIVRCSAFDSLDIYGTLDASDPHNSNTLDNTMSTPAATTAPNTSTASNASNTSTTPNAPNASTPAATSASTETKGVMLDGQVISAEEVKALIDFGRKAKQELEETKRAMLEKENLLKPVLEEQKNKALRLMEGLFKHGVAAVSEAEKKEIDETQRQLMGMVEKDPQLLARIAKFSAPEQKVAVAPPQPPVRERDALGRFTTSSSTDSNYHHHQAPETAQPREDRRSSKRTRSPEELMDEHRSSSSSLSGEGLANKLLLREPASAGEARPIHPMLRDILGTRALEQQRAVAYSAASAEQSALNEAFERNRVEALLELRSSSASASLLPTTEFPTMTAYLESIRTV